MITAIMKAWEAGKIIRNPERWKAGAELTNYITAIVTGVLAVLKWKYPNVIIPEELADALIQFLGGLLVVINVVINRVSTRKKITFKTHKEVIEGKI